LLEIEGKYVIELSNVL